MWNYSELAKTYDDRPAYSKTIIETLFKKTKARNVCDIGAGTGILTCQLLEQSDRVVAVEPNLNMLRIGETKTKLVWVNAYAENTGLQEKFDLITYGSSFNVCMQTEALQEARRILKTNGFIACLWNHRNLTDPLQKEIESIIQFHIPHYQYGKRREDQSPILKAHGWKPEYFEAKFTHVFSKESYIRATESHCTLKSQSENKFETILKEISNILPPTFEVPYKTVMWIAQ